MENIPINPHDKFFKDMLSDIDNAKSFFKDYLPPDILKAIDLNTLRICKDSFIEKDLKEFFSDILYEVSITDKKNYLYLLFEHKSGLEKQIHLQLLQYMIKIWRLHIKQKGFPLPVIIPLVLYHGNQKWNVPIDFGGLFDVKKGFKAYLPDFDYILYDLSKYTDEDIKGEVILKAALMLFKYIKKPELIKKSVEIFLLLNSIMESEKGLEALETFFRYIFYAGDMPVEKLKKIAAENLHNKGEEAIMTLAERLINQGKDEGIKQGLSQGLSQGLQKAIINTLEARFNLIDNRIIQTINSITDPQRLNVITRHAALVNSPDELNFIL